MGPGPIFQRGFTTKYEYSPIPSSSDHCTDFIFYIELSYQLPGNIYSIYVSIYIQLAHDNQTF